MFRRRYVLSKILGPTNIDPQRIGLSILCVGRKALRVNRSVKRLSIERNQLHPVQHREMRKPVINLVMRLMKILSKSVNNHSTILLNPAII